MPDYTSNNTLRIAKRFQNSKRPYLLVNPLQAKHIPVRPSQAADMMEALGDLLARKYPQTKLVIGFAETATAIGAVVAERLHRTVYMSTPRGNSFRRQTSGLNSWKSTAMRWNKAPGGSAAGVAGRYRVCNSGGR